MNNPLTRAEFLTRFLITWHQQIGINHSTNIQREEDRVRYQQAVNHFSGSDPSNAQTMKQIATSQIEGSLEVFFVEEIDKELWDNMCSEYQIDLSPPGSLGKIGA